jgi:hypothetical protein
VKKGSDHRRRIALSQLLLELVHAFGWNIKVGGEPWSFSVHFAKVDGVLLRSREGRVSLANLPVAAPRAAVVAVSKMVVHDLHEAALDPLYTHRQLRVERQADALGSELKEAAAEVAD